MTISVFTPIHKNDPAKIARAYNSLKAQTRPPDEWVLCINGEAINADFSFLQDDPMVQIFYSKNTGNVGDLKAQCCFVAMGEILVELDYDDELTPDALELINREFEENLTAVFVYSNFAEVNPDGSAFEYSSAYGWKSSPYKGMRQMEAFPPRAQYLRRIEWAPNHVRAFLRSEYMNIGGYNRELSVGDDHDLVCRFYIEYGERGFHHIDECLYIYNRHEGNTSLGKRNAEVQAQVELNYIQHAEKMYLRWANDYMLQCLDLGGRFNKPEGYKSVDLHSADLNFDLNFNWPLKDNSVGVLRAYHVLEHLDDTVHFFNEAYRVLAPGGFLLIEVPSVSGGGAAAFGDPTHKRFFHPHSFDYFTNEQFSRFIRPNYKGRFQVARQVEYLWQNPERWIISVHLIALKGWYDELWCGQRNDKLND